MRPANPEKTFASNFQALRPTICRAYQLQGETSHPLRTAASLQSNDGDDGNNGQTGSDIDSERTGDSVVSQEQPLLLLAAEADQEVFTPYTILFFVFRSRRGLV